MPGEANEKGNTCSNWPGTGTAKTGEAELMPGAQAESPTTAHLEPLTQPPIVISRHGCGDDEVGRVMTADTCDPEPGELIMTNSNDCHGMTVRMS